MHADCSQMHQACQWACSNYVAFAWCELESLNYRVWTTSVFVFVNSIVESESSGVRVSIHHSLFLSLCYCLHSRECLLNKQRSCSDSIVKEL